MGGRRRHLALRPTKRSKLGAFLGIQGESLRTWHYSARSTFWNPAGGPARLHEYISAAHPSRVKDYDAQKLLAKLRKRSKHADTAFRLHLRSPSDLSSTVLTYEPVTSMLIDAHAKLGDLLHFNFFRSNPDWFYAVSLAEHDPPSKSLVDMRKWLGEVVAELERVANSTLLSVGGGFANVMFAKDEED